MFSLPLILSMVSHLFVVLGQLVLVSVTFVALETTLIDRLLQRFDLGTTWGLLGDHEVIVMSSDSC